jgi:phage terminase Nu1 subunit (DNA packaging protein)
MAILYATSKKDAADTVGVSERTFSTWLSEGCPGDTRKREYSLLEVIQWARENKWGDSDGSIIDSDVPDDLKEELVRQKVEKLKRENRLLNNKIDMQGESLVDVDQVRENLRRFSQAMRRSLETLQKKYGRDAFLLMTQPIDSLDRELAGGAIDISSDE